MKKQGMMCLAALSMIVLIGCSAKEIEEIEEIESDHEVFSGDRVYDFGDHRIVYFSNENVDEEEVSEYYCPAVLQKVYLRDMEYFRHLLEPHFIRIQNYEWIEMKKYYSLRYKALMRAMVKSISNLIMDEMLNAKIILSDRPQIIYGDYMEKFSILYTGEKRSEK